MAEYEQVKFKVHHVRFFEYQPQAVTCLSYDERSHRVAVSRADASVAVLSTKDNWSQEMVFPGCKDGTIEALLWSGGRLFAAGISGNIVELDLATKQYKNSLSSNAGPIWCLTKNSLENQIAAGTEDGCVVLFDINEELRFLRGFGKQEGRILSIAWYNRDGESLIVTGGTNNIRQWSVKSGQPISRMTLGRKFQKDTIVWCIAVTKDFTIISGDSRGIVTFWNGKESTQLKTFECHKADVLSLCLKDDETQVFTSGVEGSIYQFSLYSADPLSERKRWVHQLLHNRHTHDVRAVTYAGGFLASGGVDSVVYVAKLKGQQRTVKELAPVPKPGLIHLAADKNLIQLQFKDYVEVWQFGTANTPSEEVRGMLLLTRTRVKLLRLNARAGHEILCSTISNDGIIAFSDTKGIRMFQLTLQNENSNKPLVSIDKVDCSLHHPAHLMIFTHDGNRLVVVLSTGSIHSLTTRARGGTVVMKNVSNSPIHLISACPDNKHIAMATLDHGVHIYDIHSGQHVCSCPLQASQVSAIAFSPNCQDVVIAYCNHSLYEFDIEKKEFTYWSRENSGRFRKNWLKPLRCISNVTFCPGNSDLLVFHTDSALCVLDKTKAVQKPDNKSHSQGTPATHHRLAHICYKYKYLLFAGFTSDGMLVVVERPPSEIEDNLPPSFKQKKFGIA